MRRTTAGVAQARGGSGSCTRGLDHELVLAAADKAVALVIARIVLLLGSMGAPYSNRRGHAPDGWTEDAWKSVIETIPGAYRPRDAKGKLGRWTLVPRAAFDAWAAAQSKAAAPANDAERWSPASALASAGLRAQRGTR